MADQEPDKQPDGPEGLGREELERELREQLPEGRELRERLERELYAEYGAVAAVNVEPESQRSAAPASVAPISLYFDLDNFGPTDIADIIGFLSELYADIGGDGLVIDDVTLLDFQPAWVPVEG